LGTADRVAHVASCEWPPSARNAAFGMTTVNHRPLLAAGDLPLLKAFKAAILNPKIARI
jgi:hypothetical protein